MHGIFDNKMVVKCFCLIKNVHNNIMFQQLLATMFKYVQSINESNFCRANIPGEARLSGATAKSVFNSKIEETVP